MVFNIVNRKIYVCYGFRWILASTVGHLFFALELLLALVLYLLILDLFELVQDVLILLFDGVSKYFCDVGKVLWNLQELGEVHIWSRFVLGLNELLNQFEIAKSRPDVGRLLQFSTLLKIVGVLVDLIRLTLFQFTLVIDLLKIHQRLLLIVLVVLCCL